MPTSMPLRIELVLVAAGLVVSGYLTLVHYRANLLVCGLSNCHTVQTSRYAETAGVPVALLGLAMYVALFLIVFIRLRRAGTSGEFTLVAFAIAFGGVLFSAYLTYIEFAVLDAICQWCVVSAILITAILVIESIAIIHLLAQEAGEQANDFDQSVSTGFPH